MFYKKNSGIRLMERVANGQGGRNQLKAGKEGQQQKTRGCERIDRSEIVGKKSQRGGRVIGSSILYLRVRKSENAIWGGKVKKKGGKKKEKTEK